MLSFSELIYFIVPLVIASTVPLALVALGALFSERSGVVNIALEGIMLMGAFVGALTIKNLEINDDKKLLSFYENDFVPYVEVYVEEEFDKTVTLAENSFYVDLNLTQAQYDKMIEDVNAHFNGDISDQEVQNIATSKTFKSISDSIQDVKTQRYAIIGILVGALVGIVFSLLHAFASINMKANQIISATALNMFAPAFAIFTARQIFETQKVTILRNYRITSVPLLGDIPVIGDLFFKGAYLSTYLGIAIFVIAVLVLYKTKWGLRLRSCGENPQAADSLGINIYKIRYAGVMVSGALAGMGGVIFVLSFAANFNATVSGFGFLALAVLIFGNWKPGRIIFAALFFASMRVLGSVHTLIPFLEELKLQPQIYAMIPYIATLVVLAITSKNSAAPRAAGEPYDPGKR